MKNFFYLKSILFFGSLLLLSFSLFTPKVLAETCAGLEVSAGPGRCGQASAPLLELMTCLSAKTPKPTVTSIGDSPAIFDQCVTSWTDDPCNHDNSSCHYGGLLVGANSRVCMDGSHAIDLAANLSNKDVIIGQVISCGGKAYFENGNHVHASVGNCGCDTWPASGSSASVAGISYTPKPICFIPQITLPGLKINDMNSGCSGGIIISSKGDAIFLYISALYKYAAGLAGVIAMFMIVFASWQWIMASGNAGKIDNAKDTIRGALLGLTLLFTGNLLLSNITSKLVDFQGLNIPDIPSVHLSFEGICTSLEYKDDGSATCEDYVNMNACTSNSCYNKQMLNGKLFTEICSNISSDDLTFDSCVLASASRIPGGSGCDNDGSCFFDSNGDHMSEYCCDQKATLSTDDDRCILISEANSDPDDIHMCHADVANMCGDFETRELCLGDAAAVNGPCGWHDDSACIYILEPYKHCSDTAECFINLDENSATSQYCCCNDNPFSDDCKLRSECSVCES